MIPQKLTLRNFMSYGDEPTTLDFAGLQLVCLSGDNGNGKSALLDAMTYALWGETRASGSQASGEDDLVRLGAEDMEVVFDFRLGGDDYRVIRKRSRRTRSGDWSVQVAAPGGEWRPIGGSTMRETKEHLQRILHMSYDTFLNSAYLQQGRADEFTRQRPERRKAILADILELSRYDRLEEMAKARQREADDALKDVSNEMRMLEAAIAEEPRLRNELAAAEGEAASWAEEKAKRDEAAQRLRAEEAALAAREQALRQRDARLKADEDEMRHDDAEAMRLQTAIAQASQLLATRDAVEAQVRELAAARARAEELRPLEQALATARQAKVDAEGRLRLREQELRTKLDTAQREWRDIEKRAADIRDWDARIAAAEEALKAAPAAEARLAEARAELQQLQDRFGAMKAEADRLTLDIRETEESLEVLRQDRATCPVCTSDLSGGKLQRVVQRQEERHAEAQARRQQLRAEGAEAKAKRTAVEAAIAEGEKQSQEMRAARTRAEGWKRQRDEAAALNANADAARDALAELRRQAEAGEFGQAERAEVAAATAEIERLTAATTEAATVRQVAAKLTSDQVEARHARILEAAGRIDEYGTSLGAVQERQARRREAVGIEREAVAQERQALAAQATIHAQARAAEAAQQEADGKLTDALSLAEVKRSRIADCDRARGDLAERKAKASAFEKDRRAYADLAAAWGKKGVQALIIENALPEVQDEANRLLARMTENAMQVQLVTQRAAKTRGSTIETLDIRIQDDAGVRPYELYSGGEAFRVNFALRIALSRLLARRAGACLQTLILDEGFGTQDAKGLERLVEAIEAIRDEFALILVISHIESMKDAFPARIEVVKTPAGSRILIGD